jgi:hypothetical protein
MGKDSHTDFIFLLSPSLLLILYPFKTNSGDSCVWDEAHQLCVDPAIGILCHNVYKPKTCGKVTGCG